MRTIRGHGARARSRRPAHSAEGEFLWLVSLSDLMILLFVFFVVLFSFAFRKMDVVDMKTISSVIGEKSEAVQSLDETQAKLLKWVIDKKMLEMVEVERKSDALILQIRENALFDAGATTLRPETGELIALIGQALSQIPAPYRVGIEGHTDDVPMRAGGEMDNWDLSSRRAVTVLHALRLSEEQLNRTVVMGYADRRPLVPNRDEKGQPIDANRQRNRRVTVRIF